MQPMDVFQKFVDYMNAAIVPHPVDLQVGTVIAHVLRWWLEFARNLLVVGGFFYLAEASGNAALKIFAWINLAVLMATVTLLFNSWHLRPFPSIKRPRLRVAVNGAVWFVLWAILFYGSIYAFLEVFQSLKVIAHK